MSAITVHPTPSPRDTLGSRLEARATGLDRFMMHAALAIEASVARRLERRASSDVASHAAGSADERRRDASAHAHMGLLPR